jgi:hypothetical protein
MTFKKILKSISQKEWIFIIITTLIVIILISIPYIYGLIIQPENTQYNPVHGFTSGDKEVYYSYIEQIKQGNFLLKDLYTSEPQTRLTFNIFWVSIGTFARIFNLSSPLSFFLFQIFLTPFLIISIYALLVLIWQSKTKRKIALLFTIFSSGLGTLLIIFLKKTPEFSKPLDLTIAEAFTFTTILNSPHLIASLMLIILTFIFIYLAIENKNIKQSIIAGILALILFQFHPYHLPTIYGVSFGYLILYSFKNKQNIFKNLKYFLIMIFISIPSIIYHLIILKIDPISIGKSYQNICYSPKFTITLMSYGLLLIGAVIYTWIFIRKKEIKNIKLFLMTWFTLQFILIYVPIQLQRRLTAGLHIPLAILTILLFFYLQNKFKYQISKKRINKYLFVFIIFIIFGGSNAFNIIRVSTEQNIDNWKILYYLKDKKIEAIEWLKNNANDQETILSGYINGGLIPSISGRTVLLGHGHETLDFYGKYHEMRFFFSINHNDKEIEYLNKYDINYIFYSDLEKKIGKWTPQNKEYLEKVFDNQEIQIYKVL